MPTQVRKRDQHDGREPELRVLREHPERYARIARQVDLAMSLFSRHCTGPGCDEGCPCPRHARIPQVVDRYLQLKEKSKWPI